MGSDSPLEDLASAVPEVYEQILHRLSPTARSFLAASSPVCRAAHKRCRLPDKRRFPVFRTADLLCSLGTVRWAQARGWSPETILRPIRASTRPGGPVAHVIGAIGAPVEVVRAFRPERAPFGFDKTCVCAAAENGHASVLAYLLFQCRARAKARPDPTHHSASFTDLAVAALDRAARADEVRVVDWLWRAVFSGRARGQNKNETFSEARDVVADAPSERAFLRRVAGAAAEGGALGVLEWCHRYLDGADRLPSTRRLRDALTASEQRNDCAIAAFGGHLETLKWLHRSGFSMNEWTCTRAAEGGHLEVLEWARENGCPWDCNALRRAEARGHARVAAWARENGCPAEATFAFEDEDD